MNRSLAQIVNPLLPNTIGNDMSATGGITAVGLWISSLISVLLIVTAIAALLYLVNGGLAWVTSGGEKGKLEGARNQITNAIIGLVIVASAWAVWLLVGKFLGIDFMHIPFPTLNTTASSVGWPRV